MRSVEELYRERPRSRFARASAAALVLLAVCSWLSDAVDFGTLRGDRVQTNLDRFVSELRPYPLQKRPWDWAVAGQWSRETTNGVAGSALLDTLSLSVAASVLAALLALVAAHAAARNLATAEPFLTTSRLASPPVRAAWGGLVAGTRLALIVVRAIPEYVLAFIALILLGPGAWPAVLALALHNAGILGKLFAEVMEDADPRTPQALRALGASRLQIAVHSLWPDSLNRFLLFFFYRWETCVREATILGLLGFSGLGYHILQAKAAIRWDELLLWTLLGSALILAGDTVSSLARRAIRRAT